MTTKFNLDQNKLLIVACACLFLTCLTTCQTCTTRSKMAKMEKREAKRDSVLVQIINRSFTAEEIDLLLRINANEIAKEVVYSNNAIVRSVTRPDDYINKKEQEEKQLRDELKKQRAAAFAN